MAEAEIENIARGKSRAQGWAKNASALIACVRCGCNRLNGRVKPAFAVTIGGAPLRNGSTINQTVHDAIVSKILRSADLVLLSVSSSSNEPWLRLPDRTNKQSSDGAATTLSQAMETLMTIPYFSR